MVEKKVTLPECNKLRFLYFKRTKDKQRNPTSLPPKGFYINTKEKGCSIQLTMVTDDYDGIDHQARLHENYTYKQ